MTCTVYIHIHTHIYTCIHTYIHTYIHTKVFAKLQRLERLAVRHVDDLWDLLSAYLHDDNNEGDAERGERLQARIEAYFASEDQDHEHLRNREMTELRRGLPGYMPRALEPLEMTRMNLEKVVAVDVQKFREDVMDLLQACILMCVCVYIYIYIYMNIHKYTQICIYTYICMYVYVYIYIYIYIYMGSIGNSRS